MATIGENPWEPLGLRHDGSEIAGTYQVLVTVSNLQSHSKSGNVKVEVVTTSQGHCTASAPIAIPGDGTGNATVTFGSGCEISSIVTTEPVGF